MFSSDFEYTLYFDFKTIMPGGAKLPYSEKYPFTKPVVSENIVYMYDNDT